MEPWGEWGGHSAGVYVQARLSALGDEASGLGAAMDAAVGAGVHRDFKAAVSEMTHLGDVFEPNKETQAVYERLYREVYLKMYNKLKPLYQEIREITGRASAGG